VEGWYFLPKEKVEALRWTTDGDFKMESFAYYAPHYGGNPS